MIIIAKNKTQKFLFGLFWGFLDFFQIFVMHINPLDHLVRISLKVAIKLVVFFFCAFRKGEIPWIFVKFKAIHLRRMVFPDNLAFDDPFSILINNIRRIWRKFLRKKVISVKKLVLLQFLERNRNRLAILINANQIILLDESNPLLEIEHDVVVVAGKLHGVWVDFFFNFTFIFFIKTKKSIQIYLHIHNI